MISGRHDHFCIRCSSVWECPQITHCKKQSSYPCPDCIAKDADELDERLSRGSPRSRMKAREEER